MGLFRYFVYQFFYFVVLRNFNFYRIYSFATFFKNKDKNYVKKNLIKIQNKNNYKFNGIAITSSNLNLNNPNNILLISSLMQATKKLNFKLLRVVFFFNNSIKFILLALDICCVFQLYLFLKQEIFQIMLLSKITKIF